MSLSIDERATIFAALSDPTRLRIVEVLAAEEELSGAHIAHKVGISLALLSHHWKVLCACGVVQRERRGQTQFCRLNRRAIEDAFECVWPQRRLQSEIIN